MTAKISASAAAWRHRKHGVASAAMASNGEKHQQSAIIIINERNKRRYQLNIGVSVKSGSVISSASASDSSIS